MLNRILEEIGRTGSVLSLDELSRRLEVEPGALEAMINHLVRQGKLRDDTRSTTSPLACKAPSCRSSCPGPATCPFAARLPHTFSLVSKDS